MNANMLVDPTNAKIKELEKIMSNLSKPFIVDGKRYVLNNEERCKRRKVLNDLIYFLKNKRNNK